jgi:hypothetical protein
MTREVSSPANKDPRDVLPRKQQVSQNFYIGNSSRCFGAGDSQPS